MKEQATIVDTLANAQAVATYKLGTSFVVAETLTENNPVVVYSLSGTGTLTQNLAIAPDPANTYKAGQGFEIIWNCNVTIGIYTISVAGFNVTAALTGNVSTKIWLDYDGTAWRLTYIFYPVMSVAGKTGVVTLVKGDVGLGLVENTALSTWAGTANITTLGTIIAGVWHGTAIGDSYIASASTWTAKASTASPTFTGTPAAPTAGLGTNTTQLATTQFVQNAIATFKTYFTDASAWPAATYDLSAMVNGIHNTIAPSSITGNISLAFVTPPSVPTGEITIMLPFVGGAWTVTAGMNMSFATITGVDTHTSVLTLIWSPIANKYIQKAFSQN